MCTYPVLSRKKKSPEMDMTSYTSRFLARQEVSIGYPANLAYDYKPLIDSAPDLFRCHFNNIGPVDKPSNYAVHTKDVEKQVLEYFCSLWKFDIEKVRLDYIEK